MSNTIVVIDIQTERLQTDAGKVSNILTGLKEGVKGFSTSISSSISSITEEINYLTKSFSNLEKAGTDAVNTLSIGSVTEELSAIAEILSEISGKIGKKDFMDVTSLASDIIGAGSTILNDFYKFKPKGKFEAREPTISFGGGGKGKYARKKESGGIVAGASSLLGGILAPFSSGGSGGSTSSSGGSGSTSGMQFITDYAEAVKTATPEVSAFAALFPNMASALEDAKLKMADLGTNIGTFVAAIPGNITAIALDTGTWIKNTAAKVANSVAQWAQNAATTAWSAICTAATAVTTAFGAVMTFLSSPIGLVVIAITALIAIVVLLIANWDTVSAKAKEVWGFVQAKFAEFDAFLKNIFAKDFTEQFGAFGHVLNAFFANVENIWNAIKRIFNGIVTFVKSVFAGDWESAWTGITEIFGGIWDGIVAFVKAPINSIIGFINSFISAIAGAVNFVIRAINGLAFDLPDWDILGSHAGQSFGFNIPEIGTFQIPLLAKGAVLPANRPFMAIVGDQRHGTNVEAPLATIQEAVALVMEDQTQAIVAGFNASIGVQREILGAVLGIRIGDDVIAHAVDRYNRKMAKMGGYY